MQNKIASDCTAILVGKGATMDGSTIVARNEDGYAPINPLKFVAHERKQQSNEVYTSITTGVHIPLPDLAYQYTATPQADTSDGIYEEAGINEYNVGMSATETEANNPRVLGYDPLVHDGLDEEAMVTVVLPYVKTAREGVQRLGDLIEKYGTGESNGIAFNDHDEVWYLETIGGHHWVAERIPDDCYAVAPNLMVIQNVDFDDHSNFMFSKDLHEFVDQHHLNPNPDEFNSRNIFGNNDEADAYYNTPRSWYGQKLFSPDVVQDPTSMDIPFLQHADRKLAVEDIEFFLSSHYNGTEYDPFGTYASGTEMQQKQFRSIAMDRNQVSAILQIRNDVDEKYAAVQWISFGFFAFSPYVPFYTNINDTPVNYKNTTTDVDMNNIYWLEKTLAVIIEPHYHEYIDDINAYLDDCVKGSLKM